MLKILRIATISTLLALSANAHPVTPVEQGTVQFVGVDMTFPRD